MIFQRIIKRIKSSSAEYEKKIDLSSQLRGFYGRHRSGWHYVLKFLKKLHNPRHYIPIWEYVKPKKLFGRTWSILEYMFWFVKRRII